MKILTWRWHLSYGTFHVRLLRLVDDDSVVAVVVAAVYYHQEQFYIERHMSLLVSVIMLLFDTLPIP